ncbi:MAG: DUF402 domain-containing protein [Oscillospiraceae bacterium]
MKRKRLDRNLKWGFQYFPYYQMQLDCEIYHGLISLITLTDGAYYYWDFPKAGKTAVCGKDMVWLQLVPNDCKRLITAMFLPRNQTIMGNAHSLSCIYVDVMENLEYDPDGVAAYVDKYLDVRLTPQGDVLIDDRDELDEAFRCGALSEKQYGEALTECDSIILQMGTDIVKTEKWCCDILNIIYERIALGEKPIENRISWDKNVLSE